MPPIRFDIYPQATPLGTLLTSLNPGEYMEGSGFGVELNGTGSGRIVIQASHAKVTAANFARGNYVVVVRTDNSEELAGFFLSEGEFTAVSAREEGGRILTFGGPGSLAYLSRAAWARAPYIASTVYNGPRDDNLWHWFQDQYGDILKRAIDEAQDPDRPTDPIPALTYDFTSTTDSASDPWESFSDSDFTIPIGENYLNSVAQFMRLGLTIWCTPNLLLQAFQNEVGTDRSSATFAAGKVRFEHGINIAAGDAGDLKHAIHETARLKNLTVAGPGSIPSTMVEVTDAGAPVDKEGFYSYPYSSDAAVLADVGAADLALRAAEQDTAIFTIIPGDDEAAGAYTPGWPGGAGHFWLGDTVTLHTGTGAYDFNELNMRVAAIRWKLRPAGDWEITLELGATYYSISQPTIAGITAPGTSQCICPHPPSPPYDSNDPAVTDFLWTFETSPYDDTTGLYPAGSGSSQWHPGYIHAHVLHPAVGNHSEPTRPPISPGTYHFRARIAGNATYGDVSITVRYWVGGSDTLLWTSPLVGVPSEEVSTDLVFPAGTTAFTFGIQHNASAIFEVELSHGGGGGSFAGDSPPPAADDAIGSIGTEVGCYALCDHKHPAQTAAVTPIDDAGGYFTGAYVEEVLQELGAAFQSLAWKVPVRVATTAAGTLASSFENGDTVDGVTLATGDRILIKDQAAGAENGIYTVNASGAPTRAVDFDDDAEVPGAAVVVMEGTANADALFLCTTNEPITLGSTTLTFAEVSGGASDHGALTGLGDNDHPQYSLDGHTHDGASAKASATSDLTATTGTAADVTGATLSLDAGTYIVIGVFDVSVKSNTDRQFEGLLDVGGTDENDLAVLLGVGLDTDDRVPVVQVWRIELGSTTTVKLQARHSGGTAGDFTVNAANTTLTAFTASTGGVSAGGQQPIAAPVGNANFQGGSTGGTADRASAYVTVIGAPMKLRGLRFRVATGGSGTVEWGLFDSSADASSCTKLAGGSAALSSTGWQEIAAASAPVDIEPGVYILILHLPTSNVPSLHFLSDPSGSAGPAKQQDSYTWSDTPDLTTGWSAASNMFSLMLRGDLDVGGNQW